MGIKKNIKLSQRKYKIINFILTDNSKEKVKKKFQSENNIVKKREEGEKILTLENFENAKLLKLNE